MSWVSVSNMLTAASFLCTFLAYHYLIKCSFGLILPLDDVYMRVNVDIYMKAVNKRLFTNMRELLGGRGVSPVNKLFLRYFSKPSKIISLTPKTTLYVKILRYIPHCFSPSLKAFTIYLGSGLCSKQPNQIIGFNSEI